MKQISRKKETLKQLFNKTVLHNGIRLVTEKIPTVRSIAFGVWVNAGGRDENEQTQGISHFLEHMIFKGTKKRSKLDIALEIESVGGLINAMTMKELTCFYTQMLDENIGTAVEVLSDIVANSVFEAEEAEKEKTVIIEEINGQEDTPDDLIFDYFFREIYPDHSLGLPILGTKETVLSFRPDDLKNFISEKYTAQNIVIAAAGNIEHEKLAGMVEQAFSFPRENQVQKYDGFTDFQTGRHDWKKPISQAHIVTGTRAYKYADPRKYAYFVLNTLLGGGMSSRLFQTIRENYGYAYSVYTFNEALYDTGVWGVYIGTDQEKTDAVLELAKVEFDRLRHELVSPDEISRIKNQLKGNLMLGLESTSSRMHRLAKMEVYINDFVSLDRILAEINKVTAEDVMEIAQDLLDADKMLTTVFLPSKE